MPAPRAEREIFGEPGAAGRVLAALPAHGALPEADVRRLAPRSSEAASPRSAASIDRLEDADWVALTQRQFEPIRAGERLWIVPTWHEPPRPGDDQHRARPGRRVRHRQPSDDAAVPRVAREARARRGHGARLRLRLGHPRHRGAQAGRRARRRRRRGSARAGGRTLQFLAQRGRARRARRAAPCLEGAFRITVANILANPLRMLAPVIAAHTLPARRSSRSPASSRTRPTR